MRRYFLVLLFIFTSFISVFAQKNKYGMNLKDDNGSYQLIDKKLYINLLKDDFLSLGNNIYNPYQYIPKKINSEDYRRCTTHKYIFKKYPNKNYVLNMEVDLPNVKLKGNELYPFIIWVHGGGWISGNVNVFKDQSQYLASRGIAGVRITYSLQKQGGHFEQGMQELEEALQYVKNHAKEWGLDSTRFGLAGASAGAPLSALMAMKNGDSGCSLYIGGNGIYDFENNRQGKFCGGQKIKSKYLENIKDFKSISAINYISKKKSQIPAVILFHGTGDITISCKQSVEFYNKVKKNGGVAELHLYKNYAHAFLNKNNSDAYEDVTIKMYEFAKRIFNVKCDYENLKFGKLPKSAVNSFLNHSKTKQVLVEPDYYVWGLSVVKWKGKYHAYYSRWKKKYQFKGWMTNCEIAHAVSAKPEGPFKFVNVVLDNKKMTGWDINNSHNPYAIVAEGKVCLYYISNNIKEIFASQGNKKNYPDSIWFEKNRTLVRNSQCIGVAFSDNPSGPFIRSEKPVVQPDNKRFKRIAVNPAVLYRNNQYTMIMKGDDLRYENWYRIQLVGHSNNPDGPFKFEQKPVYADAQTEDACIWYDEVQNKYYMVCHVVGKRELALFNSKNGVDWQPDKRKIFMKKEFTLSDGTIWRPKRVERPFVLTNEKGQPIMLYVAVADKNVSGNIAIPINTEIYSPGKTPEVDSVNVISYK